MKNEREIGNFLKRYPGVRIGFIALILLVVVGVSSAFTVEKEVQVTFKGEEYTVKGKLLESLEKVLVANDLPASDEYKYSAPLNTLFKDIIDVQIEKKILVNIMVDGKTASYFSEASNVGELLEEQGIKIDQYDRVEPTLNTAITLKTGTVKITRVTFVESTGIKDIPMKVRIKENPDLPTGARMVVQVGGNGKSNVKERIRYENGVEVSRKVLASDVITPAVEEIIEVGSETTIIMPNTVQTFLVTGNVTVESSAAGEGRTTANKDNGLKGSMTVSATAYTATGNNTASGLAPQAGRTIASWDGIPFGTQVYIPALGGVYTVEDRGGAVGYGIIDIYMNSKEDCVAWGRQNIEIYFMD
ncbi:MAG: G5 domain-containing protein [Eubacteriaceae bacterium]|nr:G5 domain-containing protein [Eubacteriaceae bacterium]